MRQRLGRPPVAVTADTPEALALHGRAGLVEISPAEATALGSPPSDRSGPGWPWVRAMLQWDPDARPSAAWVPSLI